MAIEVVPTSCNLSISIPTLKSLVKYAVFECWYVRNHTKEKTTKNLNTTYIAGHVLRLVPLFSLSILISLFF